jgi:hypothetical protein
MTLQIEVAFYGFQISQKSTTVGAMPSENRAADEEKRGRDSHNKKVSLNNSVNHNEHHDPLVRGDLLCISASSTKAIL